jgi:hypothetical protein
MLKDLANALPSFDIEQSIGDVSMQHAVLRPDVSDYAIGRRGSRTRRSKSRHTMLKDLANALP